MPSSEERRAEERRRAREVAIAVYALLRKRERKTAAILIRAEARTLKALRAVAAGVAAHAVAAIARGADDAAHARIVLRTTAAAMAVGIEREILAQRRGARTIARTHLIEDLGAVFVPASKGAAEIDAVHAHTSATSYATSWTQRALVDVQRAEDAQAGGPYRTMAARVAQVTDDVDGRMRRIASTETAHAFNDERDRIYDDFGDEPGMFKVWSAVLDGRTCSECFAIDGTTIAASKSFGKSPPVHANCRCIIAHVIIPKPKRLEDTKIDYDLFKSEMRDVIREGRAIDRAHENEPMNRHAIRLVRESQTDRTKFGRPVRSPIVLTEKYAGAVGDYEVKGDIAYRRRKKAKP